MSPTLRWFLWIARFEGLSMLVLLGVAMPLKYVAGNPHPVAWVGWTHGILVVLYLVALSSVARVEGWSWGRTAAAFVSSLLPGGTFVFEARALKGA